MINLNQSSPLDNENESLSMEGPKYPPPKKNKQKKQPHYTH